jgi:hypothetical protein
MPSIYNPVEDFYSIELKEKLAEKIKFLSALSKIKFA